MQVLPTSKFWQVAGVIIIGTLCQTACRSLFTLDKEPKQAATTVRAIPSEEQKITPLKIASLTPTTALQVHTPFPMETEIPKIPATRTMTVVPSTLTPTASFYERLIIGQSVLGKPLEVYRFGNGPNNRLIIAGIHGGAELNTIELADELMQHLRENPALVPPSATLFFLRSLNPDGEERVNGPEGRANENGVDLNRNWDAFWQAEPDLSGCWSIYKLSTGEFAHSEPETDALAKFMQIMEIDSLISYHSAGQGIYAGGQPPDPDSIRLAQRLSEVSSYIYPPIDAGCVYTGQLIDWAVQQGIVAVDIELPNKWETQFYVNIQVLEAFLLWER